MPKITPQSPAEITLQSPKRCTALTERVRSTFDSLRPLAASPRNLNQVMLALYRQRGPMFPREIAQALDAVGLAHISAREVRAAFRWLEDVGLGETLLAGAVVRDASGRYCLTPSGRQMLKNIPLADLAPPGNGARRS